MQLIKNNPYRTVGLLVGATAREQERQVKRLKQFLEAEQDPQDDFSFPTLGNLHRTLDKVNEASSKLNLDRDKMNAALFWFYKGNPITDEPAFDAIKEADLDQVLNIWSKLTSNGEVSQRNASAYSNLGTLYLSGILEGTNTKEALLEQGISLKLKFLESDFIKDFKAIATDETYKTTKKELQLLFLNQVESEIEKNGGITTNKLLDILTKQEFSAKEDFLKGFVQKPIEQIETKIEETKKKEKEDKSKAGDYGNDLYNSTIEPLTQIISLLGIANIKVISISDKLANEILQCSITLFNHFHDTETEIGEIASELNNKAKSIALGSVVSERINETIPVIESYIKGRPEREKQNIVGADLKFITDKLENFQTLEDSISNALNFANSCKPSLDNMKLKLGINDDLYSTISTAVASNAQGMIISSVNEAIKHRNHIKHIIESAWSATVTLGSFDMSNKQREHYNKNKNSLLEIYKQINDGAVFFGDTPVQKWILWVVGIGLLILIGQTCN